MMSTCTIFMMLFEMLPIPNGVKILPLHGVRISGFWVLTRVFRSLEFQNPLRFFFLRCKNAPFFVCGTVTSGVQKLPQNRISYA